MVEKGRWPLALAIVLLSLIIAAYVAMAHVIFLYQAGITVRPVSSPITVIPGQYQYLCGGSSWSQTLSGFSTNITVYTLGTTSGYVLTTPLVKFNVTVSGTLTMSLSSSSSVVSDYVNGTQIYPSPGSFSLSAGSYLIIQRLALSSPVTSTLTLSGQYSYTYTPGVSFLYSFNETINPPSANVMNLLNGQNAIYVPHVYQGDYQGLNTSSWPVYYGPSTASQYWSPLSSSISQPVLMMVPSNYSWSSGAMFWQSSYNGRSLTITMIGVYSYNGTPSGSSAYHYVGDGYIVYLFINPSSWSISSKYNYSVPYVASNPNTTIISPIQGDVMFPKSPASTYYIVVEWDPLWQYAYKTTNATGQWNVWLANNPSGKTAKNVYPYPSPNLGNPYHGWDGIGTGAFQPRPGDYICITVTYNPSTNTLSGVAYDMNTGRSASFTLSLSGFTPPSSGDYVFGVAGTNGNGQANWAIVYVNYQG
jgi:hypothetical protein